MPAVSLLFMLLCLLAPPTFAQDSSCPAPNDVITEDVQLTQHISNFPDCTLLNGDLRIGYQDCSTLCRVTGVSPLRGVTAITGVLSIQCCNSITDISGFSALTKLGSLRVYYNSELVMISGFLSLANVHGSVTISQNRKLTRISGLSSLGTIEGYLAIERNTLLSDLSGLRQLAMLGGGQLSSGHALSVTYNAQLTDLSGLVNIRNISYGTVHIEGNTALCFAGYPTWQQGAYPVRPHPSVVGADVGIDWRTRLSGVEPWQSTWGVPGGGYPTLLIRDNAPSENCTDAACHATCPDGAGCLGPSDPTLCGSCDLVGGTFDPCETATSPSVSSSSTGIIVAVVVVVLLVVIAILVGLGVWVGVVCLRRWKESRKGSFDISLGELESPDYADREPKKRRHFSSKSKPSDLIASYSAPTDQSAMPTYISTRNISEEPDSDDAESALLSRPQNHSSVARVQTSPKRRGPQVELAGRSPLRQGGTKALKHQTSSTENLLSPSSPTQEEQGVHSSQDSREGYAESANIRSGVVASRQESGGKKNVYAESANEASSNGTRVSFRPLGDADSTNGASTNENGVSLGSNGRGSYAESATNRVDNRVSMVSQASVASREASAEDILERLLQEESDVPMNFPKDQVKVTREMGRGDFGKVLQAEAKKLLPGQKKTTVVVKQLKLGVSEEERQAFLRPVEAMKILRHANVLSLMGVVSKGPALQVMLEYCALGNFKTFLVTRRRDEAALKKNGQLLKMAVDMASGLGYLHSMSVAHNDFAVRSCLVTGDGSVKLGDYGITRQTFKEDYYARSPSQKAWPVRWMAPEQVLIEGRDTLDSYPVSMPANIWSFGIALWEVCSFAQWPYDEMSNEEVIQMVVKSGKCSLENPLSPGDAVAHLFDICELCWQEPALRPTMDELLTMLKDPSTVRRKRRSSSLTRQNYISLPPSRSRATPPPTKSEPSRNGPSGDDDTLKRKPRRPAPTLPPSRAGKQSPGKSRPILEPESVRQAPGRTGPVSELEPVRRAAPQPPAPKTYSLKRPAPKKPERAEDGLKYLPADSSAEVTSKQVGVGDGRPKDERLQAEHGGHGRSRNGQGATGGYLGADPDSQGGSGRSIVSQDREPGGVSSQEGSGMHHNDIISASSGGGSVSVGPLEAWNAAFDADGADVEMVYSEDVEEIQDDSVFVGGLEATAGMDDDQDFILEPPDDFSQSSIDDLDVAPSPAVGKRQTGEISPLVQSHRPAVGGESSTWEGPAQVEDWDNEGKGFPDEVDSVGHNQGEGWHGDSFHDERSENRGEVWPDEGRESPVDDTPPPLQHQAVVTHDTSAEHKNGKARKSKKKRESKDSSEPGSKKHKSKKKKRKSASTDDLLQRGDFGLPEYEYDRGLDRVPMRTAKRKQDSFRTGQLGAWVEGRPAVSTGSHFSQEEPEDPHATSLTKGGSKPRISSSYDNIMADDSPPWLHDGNPSQSQELSFEELDAYADHDEQDEPRVVYKEDIATLVW